MPESAFIQLFLFNFYLYQFRHIRYNILPNYWNFFTFFFAYIIWNDVIDGDIKIFDDIFFVFKDIRSFSLITILSSFGGSGLIVIISIVIPPGIDKYINSSKM